MIRRQTNPVKEIGIPFERCRHCGATYINSYKEEWITKSPFKRILFFLQAGVWARAFLVPMLVLIIPMAAWDMSTETVWALWPIMSAIWLASGYFIHKKSENEDILKSLERTKDTEYLNLLKKAGYKIYPINSYKSFHSTPTSSASSTYRSSSPNKSVLPKKEDITHICLSDANAPTKKVPGGVYGDDILLQPTCPSKQPSDKTFSASVLGDGLAELCIKELLEVMDICRKYQVSYNDKKLIISTFCYFYTIWIFNYENITSGQANEVEEIYKNHFCQFNRKYFEDHPFKDVLENENVFSAQLKRVDRRVRDSYHAHNLTFVDDGLSDEYILEFIDNANDKELIKKEIIYKLLKEWAYVAHEAGRQSSVTN